ncbi:MAG: response regulator [Desulfuromonadales bacterium]|nr:response regulator [Desulfuromonadales bacterium]MDT8423874.1 response regulator [Desulfuromonadales bacterium]
MLLIECPSCAARYKVKPGKTRKLTTSIKCPACEHVFSISLADKATVASQETNNAARPKILIVDDSNVFRNILSDILSSLDVNILTAASGNDALQMIAQEHPQLVILDLVLPDISGAVIVQKIKSFRSLSATRFLILSGTIVNDTPTPELANCGADAFSSKSFKPEQLRERVAALLKK